MALHINASGFVTSLIEYHSLNGNNINFALQHGYISVPPRAAGGTNDAGYRLNLEAVDIDYNNQIEKIVIKQLTTTQKQWRNMWLEKTFVENINVFHISSNL